MDMLRGVAVLGILLININSFALPLEATFELSDVGDRSAIDKAVFAIVSALGQGKFMAMFALLFGAGVALMVDRRRERGEPTAGLHYRRIGILAAIGFIHGVFIWHGDILLPYAVCAAVLYPLLLLRGQALVWVTVGAWALVLIVVFGFSALIAWSESMAGDTEASARLFENEVELMRGGVLSIMKVRFVHWLLFFVLGIFLMLPLALALMLTGALAKRTGWITGERENASYKRLLVACLLIGLPVAGLRVTLHMTWNTPWFIAFESVMSLIDAALLCFAWGAGLVLVAPLLAKVWLGRALIAVGRMALTNYLAQSILFTTLFYGYGLGLFAAFSRAELLAFVAVAWVLQLVWSPWWLSRHERGPMEALWRSVTYLKAPTHAA